MLSKIIAYLNQPFPEDHGLRSYFLSCLWIGVFIGLFLYIFEPFGMHRAGSDKAWICTVFGIITFLVSFSFDLFLRYILKIHRDNDDWVFWKWIVSVLSVLVLIAAGNFAFMNYLGDSFNLAGFVQALLSTFLVGFFPVFFVGYFKIGRANRINQKAAQAVKIPESPEPVIVALGTDSKEKLQLPAEQIWFVEAMQNYVVVHYKQHEEWQQKIIRSTLSGVEAQLDQSSVKRSHRSFLVNRAKIKEVEGNAQGLKLTLDGLDHRKIPVSRKYISLFQA